RVTYMASRHQWQCECRYQFSVTSCTVFHKTHMDLPRWLMAVWLVCHSPKGVSSKQIQRELGCTYKTAWYMTRRIRLAIQKNLVGMRVEGRVEIDEAVIKADGGKATGNVPYAAKDVLGMVSRTNGTLRMIVLDRLTKENIQRVCTTNLGKVRAFYTDAASRFEFLRELAPRYTVTHGWCWRHEYARGNVHVNRVENAWGLFKRGLMGVYHHVNAKYLQEYLDEFSFRQSNLKDQEALVGMVLASC
ncbi:MAG: IS1595 family transposase, partial [Candidatus Bipolaricaulis sp.]|nr:IS1595 family transposase [Candidatus Bipolaricaulis sp.]